MTAKKLLTWLSFDSLMIVLADLICTRNEHSEAAMQQEATEAIEAVCDQIVDNAYEWSVAGVWQYVDNNRIDAFGFTDDRYSIMELTHLMLAEIRKAEERSRKYGLVR